MAINLQESKVIYILLVIGFLSLVGILLLDEADVIYTIADTLLQCIQSESYCTLVDTEETVYYNFTHTNETQIWRVDTFE